MSILFVSLANRHCLSRGHPAWMLLIDITLVPNNAKENVVCVWYYVSLYCHIMLNKTLYSYVFIYISWTYCTLTHPYDMEQLVAQISKFTCFVCQFCLYFSKPLFHTQKHVANINFWCWFRDILRGPDGLLYCMIMSWHGDSFCVTGALWESPVPGGFRHTTPNIGSSCVFSVIRWNMLLNKQSDSRWFGTPWR